MSQYHTRMPMIVEPKDFDAWFSGEGSLELLNPAPKNALREWIVSQRVSKTGVGDDDPTIIDEVE